MDDDDEVEEVGDLCLHLIILLIRSVKGLAHRSRAINQNNFISIVNKDKHPLPLYPLVFLLRCATYQELPGKYTTDTSIDDLLPPFGELISSCESSDKSLGFCASQNFCV